MLQATPAQPWRNGGGVTRELLAWPTAGPWQWRVSVAEIVRDGGFSAFPDVERWFAVVEGAGVELQFGDHVEMLMSGSAPLQFDGALAPGCRLLGGPTRDLNLMARCECGRAEMLRAKPDAAWRSAATLRAVFTAEPLSLQAGSEPALALSGGSLAWSEDGDGVPWLVTAASTTPQAWWLAFHPHAG